MRAIHFESRLVQGGGWISGAFFPSPPCECWFGRGPSGYLLGPFKNAADAADAVRHDQSAVLQAQTVDYEHLLIIEEDELPTSATLVPECPNDSDSMAWKVTIGPDERAIYLIAGADGVESSYEFDTAAALVRLAGNGGPKFN